MSALSIIFLILTAVLLIIIFFILRRNRIAHEYTSIVMSRLREERKDFESTAHWYKSILDAVPLPITVTDEKTCWTFVNSRVEDLLNVRLDDIKGKPCSNWGASICNTPNCGIECAKRGVKQTFFTHNGFSYMVDIEILKDINGKTAGYIEVVQDITKMEEITKKQMDAEAISRAKSSFLATVSHEIRTPLNAILGIANIEMQDRSNSRKTREALANIYSSGDLLLHIINDILDLSKIEAGKLEIVPADYDVPDLINDVVHLNIGRINNKPIEFHLNINEDMPKTIFGDEIRIKQILNNILSNAFKYTEQGDVTLSIDKEIIYRNADYDTTLIFKIADTGQGMTNDEIDNLFNEYTRFNLDTNRSTEGTGLGMSITKHLIRLMNGEIYIESKPDEGTLFTIRLPQKKSGSAVIGKEISQTLRRFDYDTSPIIKNTMIDRDPMPYGSVLIVDDVDTNLYVAKGLMSPYDLKIELASSGFEAINKISGGNIYDIIFMDQMMPKMDGMETVKKLREAGYNHPIIALTANALAGQAETFMNNGFNDFLSKPINIHHLNSLLNKYIRDKQPKETVENARRNIEIAENNETPRKPANGELTRVFTKDAKKMAKNISAAIKNNFRKDEDLNEFTMNSHSIKSALAGIGEHDLAAAANDLEQAGRSGNFDLILAKTPVFLDSLNAIIEKYDIVDSNNTAAEDSKESMENLSIGLLEIQRACEAFDKRTAKSILNGLQKNRWSPAAAALMEKIAECLLHSEFEKASSLADDFLCTLKK